MYFGNSTITISKILIAPCFHQIYSQFSNQYTLISRMLSVCLNEEQSKIHTDWLIFLLPMFSSMFFSCKLLAEETKFSCSFLQVLNFADYTTLVTLNMFLHPHQFSENQLLRSQRFDKVQVQFSITCHSSSFMSVFLVSI